MTAAKALTHGTSGNEAWEMMNALRQCAASILILLLTIFGYSSLFGTVAAAQAYLYDYSAVTIGGGPLAAVVADFNGDGRLDIATVNYANTVSVMLGLPGGTFAPPLTYATGSYPATVIAANPAEIGCDYSGRV